MSTRTPSVLFGIVAVALLLPGFAAADDESHKHADHHESHKHADHHKSHKSHKSHKHADHHKSDKGHKHADHHDGFSRSGPYLGIGGIYTQNSLIEDELDDALPAGVSIDVDDSAGFNGVIGYRMLPWLAAELQYEYVDGFDITAVAGPLQQKIEVQSHLLTANLKGIVPIGRVHPYVLVGAGVITWEFDESGTLGNFFPGSETDFAGRAGAGVDFYLTRNIVLNAGANLVLANTRVDFSAVGGDKFDYLFYIAAGGSLQYRF